MAESAPTGEELSALSAAPVAGGKALNFGGLMRGGGVYENKGPPNVDPPSSRIPLLTIRTRIRYPLQTLKPSALNPNPPQTDPA